MTEIAIILFAVFMAQVTPGPNMMAVASAAFENGRKAGLSTAVGVSIGVFLWAVIFTTSGGVFIEAFPQSIMIMKVIGGSYLTYLAYNAVRRALTPAVNVGNLIQRTSPNRYAFIKGVFVVSTNPKAALVWIAVSAYLDPLNLSLSQSLFFGMGVGLSALVVFGSYALLFSTPAVVRRYQQFFIYSELTFGVAFGTIGSKLIWDGVREVRT